jgi:hypothetical protein
MVRKKWIVQHCPSSTGLSRGLSSIELMLKQISPNKELAITTQHNAVCRSHTHFINRKFIRWGYLSEGDFIWHSYFSFTLDWSKCVWICILIFCTVSCFALHMITIKTLNCAKRRSNVKVIAGIFNLVYLSHGVKSNLWLVLITLLYPLVQLFTKISFHH